MKKSLTPFERETLLLNLLQQFMQDELSHGDLLMQLRKNVLGFSQDRYAALAGISRRTLSDIEQNSESTTLTTLNRAFRPLGLKVGVLPRQPGVMKALLDRLSQQGEDDDHP